MWRFVHCQALRERYYSRCEKPKEVSSNESLRFSRITVLGDYILSEGIDSVLQNITRCGATAVACNPTGSPAPMGQDHFNPQMMQGAVRDCLTENCGVVARCGFGGVQAMFRKLIIIQILPYKPRKADDLTKDYGYVIAEFISEVVSAGLKVYLQVGAA